MGGGKSKWKQVLRSSGLVVFPWVLAPMSGWAQLSESLCYDLCPNGITTRLIHIGVWGCYAIQPIPGYSNRYALVYVSRNTTIATQLQDMVQRCDPIDQLNEQYIVCPLSDIEECKDRLAELIRSSREFRSAIRDFYVQVVEAVQLAQQLYDLATNPAQALENIAVDIVAQMIVGELFREISEGGRFINMMVGWLRHGNGYNSCELEHAFPDARYIRIRYSESVVYIGECVWASLFQGLLDAIEALKMSVIHSITKAGVCAAAALATGGAGGVACGGLAITDALISALVGAIDGMADALDIVPARIVFEVYD